MKNTIVKECKEKGDMTLEQLNAVAPASLTHLDLGDWCDKVEQRNTVLEVAISKIRYEGFIEIRGIDVCEVARSVYTGSITVEQVNRAIYNGRKSLSNIFAMREVLTSKRLTILENKFDGPAYYLKAVRNKV